MALTVLEVPARITTMWFWFSLIAPFVILYVFLGLKIYRDKRFSIHHLRVLAYVFVAVFIVTSGPILQGVVWIGLNSGLVLAWQTVVDAVTEDCLCVVASAVAFAILPGTLIGIVSSGIAPFRRKLMWASAIGMIAFMVSDGAAQLAMQATTLRNLGFTGSDAAALLLAPFAAGGFMFSMFSNTVGAFIAAFMVITVTDSVFEIVDRARKTSSGSMRYLADSLRAAGVVGFVAVVIWSGAYFVFIHQLPMHIEVTLEDWGWLKFRAALRQIGDPALQDPVEIRLAAQAVQLDACCDDLIVRVRTKPGTEQASRPGMMSVLIATVEAAFGGSLEDSSARPAKRIFSKVVPLGDIRVKGGDLRPRIATSDGARLTASVYLARGTSVTLSRDAEDLIAFEESVAKGAPGLVINAKALSLRIAAKSALILAPNMPRGGSRHAQQGWEIQIPGEGEVVKVEGRETLCCRGPLIRMTIETDGETEVDLASAGVAEWKDVILTPVFDSRGMDVTEVGFGRGIGKALFGDAARNLRREDSLSFKGERLKVRRTSEEQLRIVGEAGLVTVNRSVVSKSVWSSTAVEIRAVIVAAILGSIGWSLRSLLRRPGLEPPRDRGK